MYCAQAELLDEFTANRALNICQMGVELGVIVREVLLRIAPKCLMGVLVFFRVLSETCKRGRKNI